MNISLRRLSEDDADSYQRLRLEGLQSEPRAFTESAAEHNAVPLVTIRTRLGSRSAADNFVLGAFDDNQLIGMAGFFRRRDAKASHRGHIWGVYISGKYRGHKVGHALLTELLALARALPGLEQITLGVGSYNIPARRLYETMGFEVYGREIRALKIGDEYVDEDLMVLHLKR